MTIPLLIPHSWSKEALFTKAQRYAEEMLTHQRDSWSFAFWSTLVLEQLTRAALAHVSPALLAHRDDWNNLYFALGHTPKATKFTAKSIDMTDALVRLGEIVDDFDTTLVGFGRLHMARRNEEVHSGATPFEGVKSSTWLPTFYRACEVLLLFVGESLETMMGIDEAGIATHLIAAAKDESAKAVGKAVEAHKTVWTQKDQKEQLELQVRATTWAARQEGHRVKCPACGSDALLSGVPLKAPMKELKGDEITETQYFLPSKFECVGCGLKISGLPRLHAAGLSEPYKATFVYDTATYFAPSDDFGAYEPDFNEM